MTIFTNKGSIVSVFIVPIAFLAYVLISSIPSDPNSVFMQVIQYLIFAVVGIAIGWLAGDALSHSAGIQQLLISVGLILGSIITVSNQWKEVQEKVGKIDIGTFLREVLGPAPDKTVTQGLHWAFLGFIIAVVIGWLYEKTKAKEGSQSTQPSQPQPSG